MRTDARATGMGDRRMRDVSESAHRRSGRWPRKAQSAPTPTSCSGCAALQVLVLIYVAPFFLALGKPVTMLHARRWARSAVSALISWSGDPYCPGAFPPSVFRVVGDAGHAVAAVPDALVQRGPAERVGRCADPNHVGGDRVWLLLRRSIASGSGALQVTLS